MTRILLIGAVLAAALVGGVAWATIPDDSGLYTACKLNATGTIRLIDPSGPSTSLLSRCTSYETRIVWNQKGPKGDTGAAGAVGPAGPRGDQGVTGDTGPAGASGVDGTDGVDGTNGAKGDIGPVGPTGPSGATTTYTTRTVTVAGNIAVVLCLANERVTGGGGFGVNGFQPMVQSYPVSLFGGPVNSTDTNARGWRVAFEATVTSSVAHVICAS